MAREPGTVGVRGAPEGLAILDRSPPEARHHPRRDPVGRVSARRGGVVGVAWVGVGVVGLKPNLRWERGSGICRPDGPSMPWLRFQSTTRKHNRLLSMLVHHMMLFLSSSAKGP